VWSLVEARREHEIVNVCGEGLISPREISRLAKKDLDTSLVASDAVPRIVDVSTAN